MGEITGESMMELHLQCFKMIHDGYDGSYINIISIVISCISILYGLVSFNLFQLYKNSEVPFSKALKYACLYFIHYSMNFLVYLCIVCSMIECVLSIKYSHRVKDYYHSESSIEVKVITNTSLLIMKVTDDYDPTYNCEQTLNNTDSTETSRNILDLTFTALDVFILIICFWLITQFFWRLFFFFSKVKTYPPSKMYNPLGIYHEESITVENLLKLCKEHFYILCTLSSVIIIFSLFSLFVESIVLEDVCDIFYSSDSCEQFKRKTQRYLIFLYICLAFGITGFVVGIVTLGSIHVKKFIIRHAFIVDDESEREFENIERNEHGIVGNTIEVVSNSESPIETRMDNVGNNGTNTVIFVDIHDDGRSFCLGNNTNNSPNQADRDESDEHESDSIPQEQVTLLVESDL